MRTLIFIITLVVALSFTSCARRVVVATPKTKIIRIAPKHHKIVIVKGKRYYFWNGRHYRKTRNGYVYVKIRS